MDTADLPIIADDMNLRDAFDRLVQSGRSACVVLQQGGAQLYHADVLNLQMPERGTRPMRIIAGGIWLPDAPFPSGSDASLIRHDGQFATVGFAVHEIARDMRVAVHLYICNVDSTHTYTGTQVKNLKKIPGGWECNRRDTGLVR